MSHKVSDTTLVVWLNVQMIRIVVKYGQKKRSKKKKQNGNNQS